MSRGTNPSQRRKIKVFSITQRKELVKRLSAVSKRVLPLIISIGSRSSYFNKIYTIDLGLS